MKNCVRHVALCALMFLVSQRGMAQTEYKFDDGVGAQVLTLTTNDTIAVYFDAVPNYIIDSIRVAFNKAGTMSFGLWRFTGTLSSPLGALMSAPSTITVGTGDQNTTLPTTSGTTKWVKQDLTSLNLSANPGFVVAGIIGIDPSTPGVLVSKVTVTGTEHSLTYTQANPAGWKILTSGSDVYRYLVRVYAHQTTPAGVDVTELLPNGYVLLQNYPNPFNGQTQIEYEIPGGRTSSIVDLSVYNVLGEKIRTLVRGQQTSGHFVAHWDGSDDRGLKVVSGVYFYRLVAEGQVSSKKMLLVK